MNTNESELWYLSKVQAVLKVQAVCTKLNLFIDDQQQLAETKSGPRYGLVLHNWYIDWGG